MTNKLDKSLGASLRRWRIERGISQRDFAMALRLKPSSLCRRERGFRAWTIEDFYLAVKRLGLTNKRFFEFFD